MITLDEEVHTIFLDRKVGCVPHLVPSEPLSSSFDHDASATASSHCPNADIRVKICNNVCSPAIQSAFLLNVVAIIVIQGILVVRIWYLFQGSKRAQAGIIIGFLISVVLSLVFLYFSVHKLKVIPPSELAVFFPELPKEGCKAVRPPDFWRLYLPSLTLHEYYFDSAKTIMYIMTGIKALRNRRLLKSAPILKRFLRDGGFFYFVVFVSVILSAIGSMLEQYPLINIPSIFSHFLLTTTSIAISRVMFSIHSLADKLGSDRGWLFNNVELSRVGWRNGAHEGELIVEKFTVYADDDVESLQRSESKVSIKETRIGVYTENAW
ncbi:hypothetical protein C0995_006072 [Termitomyces sp. Mi166|nr:hypothetical protein C0995_006072 [Termitomyces sp. Mi166\